MVLVRVHVVHTILNWNHTERMVHAVLWHVVEAVELAKVTLVTHSSILLLVPLNVRKRVRKVAHAAGVAAADGAFLEVTLQDITSRERIAAEHTHVRAITRVSEEMALEMLRVKVRLGTMRAGEFAISILHGNHCALGVTSSSWSSGSARCAGEDTAATLGTNNMSRLLLQRWRRNKRREAGSRMMLRHDATWGHGSQDRRPTISSRSRSNRLRTGRGCGGLVHHGTRGAVTRLGRVLVLLRH